MPRRLCAVLLAAGEGRRLRPLTEMRPKALCPVGNVALLDRALEAVARVGLIGPDDVAVNAWHLADAIVAHLGGARAHVGVETGSAPLGSAGGVAALRTWIDGRDVLVGNADAYLAGEDLGALLDVSAEEGVGMLGIQAGARSAEFGAHRFAGFSLIPWRFIASLPVVSSDLVRAVWRPAEAAGALRVVEYGGFFLDCGTPADYLAANLHAASLHTASLHTASLHTAQLDAVELHAVDRDAVQLDAVDRHAVDRHAAGAIAGDPQPGDLEPDDPQPDDLRAASPVGVDGSLIAPDARVTGRVDHAVIGAGARVDGTVERTVVWPGTVVRADEHLVDAIRYGDGATLYIGRS